MTILLRSLTISAALGLVSLATMPGASAQDRGGFFENRTASVTYGPYVRLGFGRAWGLDEDGAWLPPGENDPEIDFDISRDATGYGTIALGHDWMNGLRMDLSYSVLGRTDVDGVCSGASDGSSCDVHVDSIETKLRTRAVMVNAYYSPLEQRGSNSILQPFLVVGVGVAENRLDGWTRFNDRANRPSRTFEGKTTTDVAVSVGLGASLHVTRPGQWPVLVEASWQYFDFGEAKGGTAPRMDQGRSSPREPLNFDVKDHVVSVGVRVPLRRY